VSRQLSIPRQTWAAAAATTVTLMLAGCGTAAGAPHSGSTSSPTAGTSTPSSGGGSSLSEPFPDAVGTTWTYRAAIGLTGETGKTIKRVVANVPVAAGRKVTLADTNVIAGAHSSSHGYLIIHPDGSITYPFSQLDASTTVTSSSTIAWPPAAAINAGTPYHSVITIHSQGQTVTAHVTVQGKGTSSVTVPAGTYSATIIDVTMTETVLGHTVGDTVMSWDAPNVGVVKSEVVVHEGGTSETVATDELESFTHG
jgi:hypothetical protein